MGWRSLYQRFRMQKLRLDRAKENKLQHSMALRIQVRAQRRGTSHSFPFPQGSSTMSLTHVHVPFA